MIQAVVFDFDGLIIDTETGRFDAFRETFRDFGVDLPFDLYVKCVGGTYDIFNPYSYLESRLNKSINRLEVEQLVMKKFRYIMSQKHLRPGVESYLISAKRMGLKIGMATSSSRSWVEEILNNYSILDYFDSIQTADHVRKKKPDPELYLKVLDSMGVSGTETIAFEDSVYGLMAAKSAGLYCVIVPNSMTKDLCFEHYDLRLSSMEEIKLEQLIEVLKNKKLI